ncbi:hypothetical protein [Burkholderia ubonensis]|uniref:hypothetical protein n=1 Tax=Burkholderia ubonensis TaxID=101571 RepID=UPI0007594DCF|nr:hypothetical protein [Burkholderia ubonensis]KVD80447.1 hypothetical protein WI89_24755 [Burkholderia ubonensis]KVO66883.1 hypothetical protein WJ79_28025 [Burkholderia ubonensis]KVU61361.1 hypothetical protein WK71_28170 [Burkholderia ubonensis]KVU67518.1 hypothetical protein WK73_25215 [Burkholderia ubonensis]KVU78002.1 hypothetical protein WK72_30950 [Burkholderia ubonensis]
MQIRSIISHAALAAAMAGGVSLSAGTAIAQEGPAPGTYGQAHSIPAADVNITIGMHGDRYWDGHRYWRHEEWVHEHAREEHDPWRRDEESEHMRRRYDEPRRDY